MKQSVSFDKSKSLNLQNAKIIEITRNCKTYVIVK
jgi:hypothetical protein